MIWFAHVKSNIHRAARLIFCFGLYKKAQKHKRPPFLKITAPALDISALHTLFVFIYDAWTTRVPRSRCRQASKFAPWALLFSPGSTQHSRSYRSQFTGNIQPRMLCPITLSNDIFLDGQKSTKGYIPNKDFWRWNPQFRASRGISEVYQHALQTSCRNLRYLQ